MTDLGSMMARAKYMGNEEMPVISWPRAVSMWNAGQIFHNELYAIPKKGSDGYAEVKEIMNPPKEEPKKEEPQPPAPEPEPEVKQKKSKKSKKAEVTKPEYQETGVGKYDPEKPAYVATETRKGTHIDLIKRFIMKTAEFEKTTIYRKTNPRKKIEVKSNNDFMGYFDQFSDSSGNSNYDLDTDEKTHMLFFIPQAYLSTSGSVYNDFFLYGKSYLYDLTNHTLKEYNHKMDFELDGQTAPRYFKLKK